MRVVCTGQDNKHFAKDLLLIQATVKWILKVSVFQCTQYQHWLKKINTMVSGQGYFVTNKRASR